MPAAIAKPEMIRWAIDSAGVERSSLLKQFPHLPEWEAGARRPTVVQLKSLAQRLRVPTGYIYLDEPPRREGMSTSFRTVDGAAVGQFSPELRDTIDEMDRRQAWMADHLRTNGHPALEFVGSAGGNAGPRRIAEAIGRTLKLSVGFSMAASNADDLFRTLRRACSDEGILVFSSGVAGPGTNRPLDADEFRGFALPDPHAPLVFINTADATLARSFTLLHEVAHLWLGNRALTRTSDLNVGTSAVEAKCNRVAADLLVPSQSFRDCWAHNRADWRRLARRYNVSEMVVARKAADLKLISGKDYGSLLARWAGERARSRSGGGNFYRTQRSRLDPAFVAAVKSATDREEITFREACRLVGMRGRSFSQFMNDLPPAAVADG